MSSRKIGVLVSGRGSNLQSVLDRIADGYLPLKLLLLSVIRLMHMLWNVQKAGIAAVAIPRKECVSKEEFEGKIDAALRAHGAELVVLAGFMRILSGNFVNKWTQKIINIHPALLPSFPGLDAQGQALEYGVKIAGCTVHFVDEGTDSGPIILQKPVPVLNDDTEESLAARILVEEHKAMPEALRLWALGKLEIQGRRVIVHP